MPIALLGLRLAKISDTVRKHLGNILKHWLNLFGIAFVIQVTLFTLYLSRDIANALEYNFSHNSSSAFSARKLKSRL